MHKRKCLKQYVYIMQVLDDSFDDGGAERPICVAWTRAGRRIDKTTTPASAVQTMRDALTVCPLKLTEFDKHITPFPVFMESHRYLYVPRHAPLERLAPDLALQQLDELPRSGTDADSDPAWSACSLVLRDAQVPVATETLDTLRRDGGALLAAPCGMGKTVMSVWLMTQLRMKTLVLVHKTFLLSQFADTIRRFCPGLRVGIIQGKLCNVHDKHVVLAMLQTVCGHSFNVTPELRAMFDFVVVDECHHIAARVFSRAMLRFSYTHSLGLSATPERKDGLNHVIHWFVGSHVVHPPNVQRSCAVRTIAFKHPADCGTAGCKYGTEHRLSFGARSVLIPSMVTDVTRCDARTRVIVDTVRTLAARGRDILVVSDRVDHLRDIARRLTELTSDDVREQMVVGLYIGTMKQAHRDHVAATCNVILGTYGLVREGLDIQKLNTLVLATPVSDVVQTVGRIMRAKGVHSPLVIDVVDAFSTFAGQARRRKAYYRSQGFAFDANQSDEESVSSEDTDDPCMFET